MKVITYPNAEDVKLSDKQIEEIARAIKIEDVINHIKNNTDEYIKFLKEEVQNGNMTEKKYKEELKHLDELKQA